MGLGCAKTPWRSNSALPLAIQVQSGPVLVEDGPYLGGDYAVIAAMSGRIPMMFVTRVRL
jgi:hypothetical protein